MDLVIDDKKEESYKIKYGADVYSVAYPSWAQAKKIEKSLKKIKETEDEDKISEFITESLVGLGLDKNFFKLQAVKAHHILKIWSEINSIKK
jgi:hypothetical protein